MAKKGPFDWNRVHKGSGPIRDSGYYDLKHSENKIGHTNEGLKQYIFTYEIMAPKDLSGQLFFDRFTVGTQDDPDAEAMETWENNFMCGMLRKMLEATGVELEGNPDDVVEATEGKKVGAQLGKRTGKKKAGSDEVLTYQSVRYYKFGERKAGLLAHEDDDGAPRPKKESKARDAEEEEAEEERPPKKKRVVEPDDDD